MLELGIFNDFRLIQLEVPNASTQLRGGDVLAVRPAHLEHPALHGVDLQVTPCAQDGAHGLEIINHGRTLFQPGGQRLEPGAGVTLQLPVRLSDGDRVFVFDNPSRLTINSHELATIERPRTNRVQPVVSLDSLGKPPGAATISRWLETLGVLQRSAASSPEFFRDAAKAVTKPGGLDMGLVLLRNGNDWEIKASCWVDDELGVLYRRDIIDLVVSEARTFFHAPATAHPDASVVPHTAVVASPVFQRDGNVVGVVYGTRSIHRRNTRQGVRPLEAQWVQLVAESVSAGITRLDAEAEAVRTRVLLEQAFPPAVVRELERNPQALRAEERELTMLFADVRRSTHLATQLDPTTLNDVFSDVLEMMTHQVLVHGGVIVDYAGDGLAAMWNAPSLQADHAAHACQAGLALLQALPELNDKWAGALPEPLQVGMGVHTGLAMVGNTGSHRRFKYGPRGPNVALACRVEDSTKQLGVHLAITDATRRALGDNAATKHLGSIRYDGFDRDIDVFELCALTSGDEGTPSNPLDFALADDLSEAALTH